MRRTTLVIGLLLIVSTSLISVVGATPDTEGAAAARERSEGELQLYTATMGARKYARLVGSGYDIASVRHTPGGVRVSLVLSAQEKTQLTGEGVALEVFRDTRGRTQTQRAAAQARGGFKVWRPYDGANGIANEIRRLAQSHPDIAELRVLGETHKGREILAIRLTQGVRDVALGTKPAVLYQGTTHAREWISTEVTRRLMRWFVEGYPSNERVRQVLETTELWFVPVLNPDGYQYTFDVERLWRKNLRDNDSNGAIDINDGVDLNRNYPEHWNYDDEGSSSDFYSETYRGPTPASEPETQASMSVFDSADLRFAVSYHSFGRLLLYPQGWQVQTPSADDPIYVALTGTDSRPAVEGFDPDVASELYTTNGEFTDWAHGDKGVLAWTPELSQGCGGCGFVFPDKEDLVHKEFQKNVDFALSIARSAEDPDDPVSHLGRDTARFYLDVSRVDPYKRHNPLSDLTFDLSYAGGSAQTVEVLAKRALGDVTLHYRVEGGGERSARTTESPEGEIFGGNNAYNDYYHYVRGDIPVSVGDEVEYWFTSGNASTRHTNFDVVEDSNAEVLILAAEDRTGSASVPKYTSTSPGSANYLSLYKGALRANGIGFDVYDVDARDRTAPDHLGVLSHYDSVIWYTGNDVVTREPGWGPGNVSRLANDMTLEVRQYLNENGNLLYTGQWAGALENGFTGAQFYDPVANKQCVVGDSLVVTRCQFLADKNDFLQYYLGAYLYNSDSGTDLNSGDPRPVEGVAEPFTNTTWELNGGNSADNQVHTAALFSTSSLLKRTEYPYFASDVSANWQGVGQPFEPFDGTSYLYSQQGDVSYKRLQRTLDLTGTSAADKPALTFRFSYDTEPAWDFVFVAAHTVGRRDGTTLADANGHTSRDTGASCADGWFELHPLLERYQGRNCSGSNARTGGEWHASSGRSRGWEAWKIDLADYAGKKVTVSIAYASDWVIQGVGSFVDQIVTPTGEGNTSFEADADPMDGWVVTGSPRSSADNPNDWIRTQSVGFEEGAIISADDTLYFGFGFEGIKSAEGRAAVMRKSLNYLSR